MMKVLVTGGAGYIGSHTCKALSKAGHIPVVYDNLVYGHEWAVKWGALERGDILDRERLDDVIRRHEPQAAIHFAAFTYVGESVANPGKYYRNNVAGSLTLLEAIRDSGIANIVFSSTAAVYGIPKESPINEDLPRQPINPYGESKLAVEHMLRDFHEAHGLNWMALRYFNAAGADPDGEIGEDHDPETHLIPLVLKAITGERDNITVFGTDYDTPDGTCIRDYIHVTDLADAHVRAIEALAAGASSGACNLGNGTGFSVREVIESARKVTGRDVPMKLGERRPGDPAVLVSDATRAQKELGWTPTFRDLNEIVRTAWEWERKHFGR